MTKEQLAIALYGLFDRLWVKSEGVISKDESRALMEAAQFFQNEANVVAVVEPSVERQGTTFGCSVCGETVTLLFTDATQKSVDVRPMHGWIAGPGGCFCPRCALNRSVANNEEKP